MTTSAKRETWTISVEIEEKLDETEARASLEIEGTTLGGWAAPGPARTIPACRASATNSRRPALSDLAHRILEVTAVDVEGFSSGTVHLHS